MREVTNEWIELGKELGRELGKEEGKELGERRGKEEGLLKGLEPALQLRFGDDGVRFVRGLKGRVGLVKLERIADRVLTAPDLAALERIVGTKKL